MSDVVFENCNLQDAIFENTVAKNTDFRTAINYKIDPEHNVLTGAKFTTKGLQGLLGKYKLDIED
uniref:pentapeptide repeat-containing protein n=1 Tax=Aquimarina rhodophyticola TaxID=3342246 RepID=UPI00406BDAC6